MKQDILNSLCEILEQRKQAGPDESYTAKLFSDGLDSILKKVGEEATETVIASKSGDNDAIIHEIADLWFHTLVLLKFHGLDVDDILKELESRFGLSGLEEKANRNSPL
jgi:phosphoribosyl-ATP pyrophosphohydrolase